MNGEHYNWPSGFKRTRPRAYVLGVLDEADEPLSAADIYAAIDKKGLSISLSTIYRILEQLVTKNAVIKTTIMDNDMAIYELNRKQHKHYAVCMNCHKVVPLNNCPLERFTPRIEDNEFHVMGHKVEIYGYCKDCDKTDSHGRNTDE